MDLNIFEKLYFIEHLSLQKIAKYFKVGVITLKQFIKENNIQLLSRSELSKISNSKNREARSNSMKGKIMSNEHKRKIGDKSRGRKLSEESRKKISNSRKGISPISKGKTKLELPYLEHCGNKKEYHWNWKGGISDTKNIFRNTSEYKSWRNSVFQRDNYCCTQCGKKGYLHAHHIKHVSVIIKENELTTLEDLLSCVSLLDTNNGITLCKECHKLAHSNN